MRGPSDGGGLSVVVSAAQAVPGSVSSISADARVTFGNFDALSAVGKLSIGSIAVSLQQVAILILVCSHTTVTNSSNAHVKAKVGAMNSIDVLAGQSMIKAALQTVFTSSVSALRCTPLQIKGR
jgi:hypothetical protein